MNKLYAKSNGETIHEHTDKLLMLLSRFINLYSSRISVLDQELIALCCQYHDYGKCNSRFQNKIMKIMGIHDRIGEELDADYLANGIDEVPHGLLSSMAINFCELELKYGKKTSRAIITAISNHHIRFLIDKNNQPFNRNSVRSLAEKEMSKYIQLLESGSKVYETTFDRNAIFLDNYNANISLSDFWEEFIYYKGMLNKFDYGASGDLTDVEISSDNATEKVSKAFSVEKYKFNECQKYMLEHKGDNIIVIASTGIGKTEAALLWQGDCKTFYTLPIKVAINAIYERIIAAHYYADDKVAYLHSDTLSNMLAEESDADLNKIFQNYSRIKDLSYPLTICTVDQLFTFVMKAFGTEILPATLSYSNIIIDEIQSYSPEILAFIIYGLSVITKLGGKFCIMSATLPPCVPTLLKKLDVDFKVPSAPFYKISGNTHKPILRHNIDLADKDFDYDKIVEQGKDKKVLVIVNTVFRAQEVYNTLICKGAININLLHSRYRACDRKQKEASILNFATTIKSTEKSIQELTGIWVSTQIVEASLDIDFDILHTDMATGDSLLQRLGRCFRNRDNNSNLPNVFIYNTKYGVGSIYDKDIYLRSWDGLIKLGNGFFEEEAKYDYINSVYDVNAIQFTKYYKTIVETINHLKNLLPGVFNKVESEKRFRNINNVSLILRSDYETFLNEDKIARYNSSKKFDEKFKIIDEIRNKSIIVPQSCVKYSNKAKLWVSDAGIQGFRVVDNIYNLEEGLTNKSDDEIQFV